MKTCKEKARGVQASGLPNKRFSKNAYTNNSAVERLLPRLDLLKETGAGTWMACCPAHDDRRPSLSIKDGDDRVLLHCFAGCPVEDITAAIGLEMRDLFNDSRRPIQRPRPTVRKISAPTAENLSAAEAAAKQWERGEPADPLHGYLVSKDIGPNGARQSGVVLLVPVMGADGEIQSLQRIMPDGTKRFTKGGRMKGGRFVIGDLTDPERLVIAEGFATAASCYEATGLPAVVAFNAGNLAPVAESIREQLPDAQIVLAADDDRSTKGNPGAAAAQKAARAVSGLVAMPGIEGDFNDLHAAQGPEAVRAAIDAAEPPVFDDLSQADSSPAVQFDLSHDQLALELGSAAGWNENARFVAAWGRWLFWDGTALWEQDERLEHMTRARDFLRDKAVALQGWAERMAHKEPDKAKADQLLKWARVEGRSLRSTPTRNAVIDAAKSNLQSVAVPEQFDARLDVVATPAGAVELRTGKLRPAVRGDYFTRAVTASPQDKKPRRWLQFLDEAMQGNTEMVAFLQRLAGYALTGETREHKLPFLWGPGGNGKSVFCNTLFELFGTYARKASAETFLQTRGEQHPTNLAGLAGARLVVASELPAGRAWNESVIKDLTGGDVITARYMRQDFFDYVPQFTLLVVGNHMPQIGAVDAAIRRRLMMIPFTNTPRFVDQRLEEKLRAEHGAILSWAIEGARAWYSGGLQPPQTVIDASNEYAEAEDVLGQFIEAELIEDPQTIGALSSVVHERYSLWMERQGGRAMSNRALSQALTERGFRIRKGREGRHLEGWRLRDVGGRAWAHSAGGYS